MTLQDYAAIGELIGAIAVVISLLYVGLQIRDNTRVNSAAARHAISEFALEFSKFNADHADRLAKVMQEVELDEPDRLFRWWCHMMVILHAETYFHSFHVGMMPESHWQGYVKYVRGYLGSPGISEFWTDVGPAFSQDFSRWIDEQFEQMDYASSDQFT
jgi:hypothetical protein